MRLRSVSVEGWRNLAPAQVPLGPGLVVLWGENGAGKTNLLEAVAVLSTLRSFRANAWNEVVSWGRGEAQVGGRSEGGAGPSTRQVRVVAGPGRVAARRVTLLDGAETRALDRWFLALRAVVFTPDDTGIVRGGPEERRRFLDRAAFNAHPAHLDHVRAWRRAVAQKAALLRSNPAPDLLDVWDDAVVRAGVPVARGRARAAAALAGPLATVHADLSGGAGATLRYRGTLGEGDDADLEAAYRRLLADARAEEVRRALPLVGIQRDDLDIRLDASGAWRPARTFGSQGQVRTLALALRLAELSVAGAQGEPPLLLVDDLSSEVDAGRLARLVALLGRLSGQVLVTTTDPDPLVRQARGPVQTLRVRSGTVDPEGFGG